MTIRSVALQQILRKLHCNASFVNIRSRKLILYNSCWTLKHRLFEILHFNL